MTRFCHDLSAFIRFHAANPIAAIELLYRVVGKGTQILAGLINGSQVEISGPLGGSYTVDPAKKNIVFIAGGIGIAPLSLLAQYLCRKDCLTGDAMTFYLGAQTAEAVVGLDRIQKLCYKIIVCTDDGSLGEKSLVTKIFQKDIKNILLLIQLFMLAGLKRCSNHYRQYYPANIPVRCRWKSAWPAESAPAWVAPLPLKMKRAVRFTSAYARTGRYLN